MTLAPKETKILAHAVQGNDYPVNYLVVNAGWKDTHSVLDLRFERNDSDRVRNNFMGLTDFPLKKDQVVTVFSTAHAVKNRSFVVEPTAGIKQNPSPEKLQVTQQSDAKKYEILLNLLDQNKKLIQSFSFKGGVSGDVTGYEADYTPSRDYSKVYLQSIIKSEDGQVLDESELEYDCSKINADSCISEKTIGTQAKITGWHISLIPVIVVAVIILIIIIVFVIKKRKQSGITFFLILPITGLLLFSLSHSVRAETKSSVALSDHSPNLAYKSASAWPDNLYWWTSVGNIYHTVIYTAKTTLTDSNIVLSPGDKFQVSDYTRYDPNSITWLMTGCSVDSPIGYWNNNAVLTNAMGGLPNDLVYSGSWPGLYGGTNYYYLYTPLVVNPPAVNLNATGPVNCHSLSDGLWECTVTGGAENKINLSIDYGNTYGKQYYDSRSSGEASRRYTGVLLDRLNCNSDISCNGCAYYYEWRLCWFPPLVNNCNTCSSINFNIYSQAGYLFGPNADPGDCSVCSEFNLSVPGKSISFEYNVAAAPNNPPTPPVCQNCPASITLDPSSGIASGTFNIGDSTDPDNDKLKYEVDWDMDGIADVTSDLKPSPPANPYSNPFSKSWTTVGLKNFQARAVDEKGAFSEWVPMSVNVTQNPIDGQCKTPPNNGRFCPTDPPLTSYGDDQLCDVFNPADPPSGNIHFDGNNWTWACSAQGSGTPMNCQAQKGTEKNGECGTVSGQSFCGKDLLATDSNLCKDNVNAENFGNEYSKFTWDCPGVCGGAPANCSAPGPHCGWIETNPNP